MMNVPKKVKIVPIQAKMAKVAMMIEITNRTKITTNYHHLQSMSYLKITFYQPAVYPGTWPQT